MPGNQTRVTLLQKMQFAARTGSGHEFVMDSGSDTGGENAGARPMETLLAALGGCTGMDVISILRKMRQDVSGYEIELRGEQAVEHPRVYAGISLTHVVRGRDLREANVRRAIELTMERYCPVYAMLAPGVPVIERYEIFGQEGEPVRGEIALAGGE